MDVNNLTGNGSDYEMDLNTANTSVWNTDCMKKEWAESLNLTWDGITNSNKDCSSSYGKERDTGGVYKFLSNL